MKSLRIFSPTLKLLAEIDNYESMTVTRKWHTFGEIDLIIHQDKAHVDKLVNGNILLPGNDFENAAVIRHRESQLDTLTIKALFLSSYLAQRVVVPFVHGEHVITELANVPAGTMMRVLVEKNAVNPDNPYPDEELIYYSLPFFPAQAAWRKPYREIKLLGIRQNDIGKAVTRHLKYQNLADELESISKESGLGWGIRFDKDKLIFEIYEGNDHAATSDNPVIFSPDFDNIMSQVFIDSQIEQKNVVYGEKEGEGIVEAGYSFGHERFETYVSVPTDENTEEAAERRLQEGTFTLEAEAIDGTFDYKKNYDLGDIVTIQNKKWGIRRDARITQVQEVYEPLNNQVYVTFGDSPPTLVDKVKSEIKRLGVR